MEKVTITPEQAKEIEKLLETDSKINVLRANIQGLWIDPNHVLSRPNIKDDDLARALYIGYEVEPEFKVGNFVTHSDKGMTGKIIEIKTNSLVVSRIKVDEENEHFWFKSNARHSTPSEIAEEKERRWWAKHGRKPWELKNGDIIYPKDDANRGSALVVERVTDPFRHDGDIKVIIQRGGMIPHNIVRKKYRVACFSHQRLDVKDNDL